MAFLSWDPRIDDEEFSTKGSYAGVVTSPDSRIPILDKDAWPMFPNYQEVYNKLKVSQFSGLNCSLVGSSQRPKKYPVIARPIYNLYGMGMGAEKITLPSEFDRFNSSGYFWSEFLSGGHFSWDIALVAGEIKWQQTWVGQRHSSNQPGMIKHWATREASPYTERKVANWVEAKLAGFTGMINLETIGGHVIECHLRVGDALYMCNANLLQAIVNLYEKGTWDFQEPSSDFYIIPVWVNRDEFTGWPKKAGAKKEILNIASDNFDVWSIEVDDDWPGDPKYATRVMFLGCQNLTKGNLAADKIKQIFAEG